jgi:hypothetical protein
MPQQPINLSPDLTRLRDDGYEVEIIGGYLVIRGVPYVNARKQVRRGTLVSQLTLAGNKAVPPETHVALFAGEYPCDCNGAELGNIRHSEDRREIGGGLVTNFAFSSKPAVGRYADYYEKMTTYTTIIASPAEAIDPNVTARTFRVIESTDAESVFNYCDTATSNAGITAAARKLELGKVAILGGGGSGSYVLDFVAKTPVKEIHIFDRDRFLQHNAFRAPGAPSIEQLREIPYKVNYLAEIYRRMRKGIIAHNVHVDASNAELLNDLDFVFLCMDGGDAKKALIHTLEGFGIPFVDVGMGIEMIDDRLTGIVRTTLSTADRRDHVHVKNRIPLTGDGHDNLYATNIQVAELNALNAALAVIKWKKLYGFYADTENEYFSAFMIDGNTIVNDDRS